VEKRDSKSYSGNMDKSEIIEIEVLRINSKATPDEIGLFVQDLAAIPSGHVSECFQAARQANTRFRVPNAAQILSDWDPHKGAEGENIRNHSFWTIESLPWCYVSNRHRHLIHVKNAGTMTNDEALEWLEVKRLHWFQKNLRLNENIAEKINSLENPGEIVNFCDLPKDITDCVASI